MDQPRMARNRSKGTRVARRLAWIVAALAVALPIAALAWLSAATVEVTSNGVPTRLQLPVSGERSIAFPINVARGPGPVIPGFLDGPVVHRHPGGWTARWFCEDRASSTRGTGDTLELDCAGAHHAYALGGPEAPPAVAPMPARLVVLSDLEGNAAFLDAALQELGVTGPRNDWRFGDGQLLVLGDSVDRGRDVFAVLWRLHGLSLQATDAGGAVRVVLGNHDQYMLRANPTRAHPGHIFALNAMGGYVDAFAADTVIGAWLRRQPVVLKLGDVLFTHAGISPDVAGAGLSVAEINDAMARYWDAVPGTTPPSPAMDAAIGLAGVTQYRGYFRGAEGRYAAASTQDVARVLRGFGARRIVVAHTVVPRVEFLHDGRVLAVDVNDNASRSQVLVFEAGAPRVIDLAATRRLPETINRDARDFSLSDPRDRALLANMVTDLRRLSSQPWPY